MKIVGIIAIAAMVAGCSTAGLGCGYDVAYQDKDGSVKIERVRTACAPLGTNESISMWDPFTGGWKR